MYEVVQSFRSRAYGDLSIGDELTESQYQMLSSSEKDKVRRKLNNRTDTDDRSYRSGADYLPFAGGYYDSSSDSGSSSHQSSFGGYGGGDSGGGGSSDSWSDSGSSDSGGGGD